MRLTNSEPLPQNTEPLRMRIRKCRVRKYVFERSDGSAEYIMGMYALIFVMVIALVSLQILQYRADSDIAEDALAASCLAALDVDPYRYGTDHRLLIEDPVNARRIFAEALKKNMRLNDAFEPLSVNASYVFGKVNIDDFRIYLTDGDSVKEYIVTDENFIEVTGVYGKVSTPSGKTVHSAGAYAEISFDTKGFMGASATAHKNAYAEMLASSDGI